MLGSIVRRLSNALQPRLGDRTNPNHKRACELSSLRRVSLSSLSFCVNHAAPARKIQGVACGQMYRSGYIHPMGMPVHFRETNAMTPLEQLFALEVEFYRRLRMDAGGTVDASSPHTSYALQAGYEGLIPAVGVVSVRDIDKLRERLVLRGDPRDVLRARDSMIRILGIDACGH